MYIYGRKNLENLKTLEGIFFFKIFKSSGINNLKTLKNRGKIFKFFNFNRPELKI